MEDEQEVVKNIYQRINAVQQQVTYIKKDKKVQGYQAVTHDEVTARLRDACVENGIVIVPKQLSSETVDSGMTTSNGNPIIRYEAGYSIAFVNIYDPKDKLKTVVYSHANDTGDKAPGKALSYAVKAAELKVFQLETGENEESRVEGERRSKGPRITEEQVKTIEEFIKDNEVDNAVFVGWLHSSLKIKGGIEDIPENAYEDVMFALNKKVKK